MTIPNASLSIKCGNELEMLKLSQLIKTSTQIYLIYCRRVEHPSTWETHLTLMPCLVKGVGNLLRLECRKGPFNWSNSESFSKFGEAQPQQSRYFLSKTQRAEKKIHQSFTVYHSGDRQFKYKQGNPPRVPAGTLN